jgi:hypothetical protein
LLIIFLACSLEEFSLKVQNEKMSVFLFCLSNFDEDFSPEIKRFATSHSHHPIYGINSYMVGQLARKFGVPTTAGFMLWQSGAMVAQFSGTNFAGLMHVLRALELGAIKT